MGKGNHRFRLSDMMPNAWFYKLKDITRSSSSSSRQTQNPKTNNINIVSTTSLPKIPAYYDNFNTQQHKHFPNPTPTVNPADPQFESPRRSSTFRKRYRSRRRTIYRPSPRPRLVPSSDTDSSSDSVFYKPFPKNEDDGAACSESESSDNGHGQVPCSSCSRVSRRDVIIDMKEKEEQKHQNQHLHTTTKITTTTNANAATKPRLPPIITKAASKHNLAPAPSLKLHAIKRVHNLKSGGSDDKHKENNNPAVLRTTAAPPNYSTNTTGIRIRVNSPRIASRKILQSRSRQSVSSPSSSLRGTSVKFRNQNLAESVAVVKSSVDPEGDFRASMAEMIKENKISASNSKDLEDLLACYLSLNSRTYHNHIVKAFEQIWFDLTHSPCN